MDYIKRLKLAFFMVLVSALCFTLCIPYFVKGLNTNSSDDTVETIAEIKTTADDTAFTKKLEQKVQGIGRSDLMAKSVGSTQVVVNEVTVEIAKENEQEEEKEPIQEELAETSGEVSTKQDAENETEFIGGYGGYTAEDVSLLTRITYAEAGICDESTRQAVAATVLARSNEMNMSIEDVIFAPGQFTPAINGQIYRVTSYERVLVTDEMAAGCLTAVHKAIDQGAGEEITSILGGEPIFFYAPSGCTEEALADRANVPAKYYADKLVFYRSRY